MVLVNFVAFVVFRIHVISFPCKTDLSKILKTVQCDLNFIFYVHSEYAISFVSNLDFLAVENVVSFT